MPLSCQVVWTSVIWWNTGRLCNINDVRSCIIWRCTGQFLWFCQCRWWETENVSKNVLNVQAESKLNCPAQSFFFIPHTMLQLTLALFHLNTEGLLYYSRFLFFCIILNLKFIINYMSGGKTRLVFIVWGVILFCKFASFLWGMLWKSTAHNPSPG